MFALFFLENFKFTRVLHPSPLKRLSSRNSHAHIHTITCICYNHFFFQMTKKRTFILNLGRISGTHCVLVFHNMHKSFLKGPICINRAHLNPLHDSDLECTSGEWRHGIPHEHQINLAVMPIGTQLYPPS